MGQSHLGTVSKAQLRQIPSVLTTTLLCSNAVAIKNLLRLGQVLENKSLIDRANESIISFHTILTKYPFAMPALVSAYMMYDKGIKQVSHHMIPT